MRNQLENVQEKYFEQLFTNDNPPVQTFHPTRSKCSKEFSCLNDYGTWDKHSVWLLQTALPSTSNNTSVYVSFLSGKKNNLRASQILKFLSRQNFSSEWDSIHVSWELNSILNRTLSVALHST